MKKTIVITGASRGIGKAIAIELAGKDTNIVINCVNNVDKLNEVKSIIEEKGSVCETFIGDMGNYSDVQKMFDMCLSTMPEYLLSDFSRIWAKMSGTGYVTLT